MLRRRHAPHFLHQQKGRTTHHTVRARAAAIRAGQRQLVCAVAVRQQLPAAPAKLIVEHGRRSARCGQQVQAHGLRTARPQHPRYQSAALQAHNVVRSPHHIARGKHARKVRGDCAQRFHRRPRGHVGAVQPVIVKARQAAANLRKLINRSALGARCQRQRKSLNDKRALLLHGYIYKRVGPGQQRVIKRGSIGLIQPDGLRQAILVQKFAVQRNQIEHRLRAKVDVQCGGVKIKIVGAGT